MEVYVKVYLQKVTLPLHRVLALSKETLVKFTPEGESLKLDAFIRIKDIKEANASIHQGKFKLDIVYNS